MNIKIDNGELFKFLFEIRKNIPRAPGFYCLFFLFKCIGIIISTHNIKFLENFGKGHIVFSGLLEHLILYNYPVVSYLPTYAIFSILIFIILLLIAIAFLVVFLHIKHTYEKATNIYDHYLIKLTKKKTFKQILKILTFIWITIIFLSQHLMEYLSFGIAIPIFKKTYSLFKEDYRDTVTSELFKIINNEYFNIWIIFIINIFSSIILFIFVSIFVAINSTLSLFAKYGTNLYSNLSMAIFINIFTLFQPLYGITHLYIDRKRIEHKFILNISAIVLLSIVIFLHIKKPLYYISSVIPKINLFIFIWCWFSGFFEFGIYCWCDDSKPFTQLYSILKFLIELASALLIESLILRLNKDHFLTKASYNLFSVINFKNTNIGEMFQYIKTLSEYLDKEKESYFKLINVIDCHKKACTNTSCLCHEIDKLKDDSKENKSIFFKKSHFIAICEQEIINRIYYLNKKKSNKELSKYCVFHVQYVFHIKKDFYYALYLASSYLNNKNTKLGKFARYFLYEFKRTILHEIFDITKISNKAILFQQETADFVDTTQNRTSVQFIKMLSDLKLFYNYIMFSETTKNLMMTCCENLDKIISHKTEINRTNNKVGNNKNINPINNKLLNFILMCESITIKINQIQTLVYRYTMNGNKLTDSEMCYYLYHFFMLIYQSIPTQIESRFKEVCTYNDLMANFNNTISRYNLTNPMILTLNTNDENNSFSISYAATNLCESLKYSKSSLIDKPFNTLIPTELGEFHTITMKKFLFIPNAQFTREETFLLNKERHVVNTTISVKLLPSFNTVFDLIVNVKFITIESDNALHYNLILDKGFMFLSICRLFEEQFFFNLKMFQILKMTFCDFFGINYDKLQKEFNFIQKHTNLKEHNRAISIYKTIPLNKMFKYRKSIHSIKKLFSHEKIYKETISKKQLLQGIYYLTKTIDETGLDIEWFNKVHYLEERMQLKKETKDNTTITILSKNHNRPSPFEVEYTSRDIGNIRYYIIHLIEKVNVKEVGINLSNCKDYLIFKTVSMKTKKVMSLGQSQTGFTQNSNSSKNILGSLVGQNRNNTSSTIISHNVQVEKKETEQNEIQSVFSKQKTLRSNYQLLDSNNNPKNVNNTNNTLTSNSQYYNQSTNSKINLISNKKQSPRLLNIRNKKTSTEHNNLKNTRDPTTTINNKETRKSHIFSLYISDNPNDNNSNNNNEHINSLNTKSILARIKFLTKRNKFFFYFLYWFFLIGCVFLIIQVTYTQIAMKTHRDLFHINTYTEILKTDIYLGALTATSLCTQIAFKPTSKIDFQRISYQMENLSSDFASFQYYINKFYHNQKLKVFFSYLNHYEQIQVIKSDWSIQYRMSTLNEEVNLIHYYMKYIALLGNNGCRVKTIFKDENYKNLNSSEPQPNLLEKFVFYTFYNLLTVIKRKFEDLLEESITVLINYYDEHFIEGAIFDSIGIFAGIVLVIVISLKVNNDKEYFHNVANFLKIRTKEEDEFKEDINLFKDILIGVKGKTISMYDNRKMKRKQKLIKGVNFSYQGDNINQSSRNVNKSSQNVSKTSSQSCVSTHRSRPKPNYSNSKLKTKNDGQSFANSINSINNTTRSISVFSQSQFHQNSTNTNQALNSYDTTRTTTVNNNINVAVDNNNEMELKNATIQIFNCHCFTSVIFLIIFDLLVVVHIILIQLSRDKFVYSIIMAMNFLEKMPKLVELFLYSQQSAMINDITFLPKNYSEECGFYKSGNSILNFYNIQRNESQHSQIEQLTDSYYATLYYQSLNVVDNIKAFIVDSRSTRQILHKTLDWEHKFNIHKEFCINSVISRLYAESNRENKQYKSLEEIFNEVNLLSIQCNQATLGNNDYGLDSILDLYYQELTNVYLEFAKESKITENAIEIFFNKDISERLSIMFECGFKNVFIAYSYYLLEDLKDLFNEEKVISLVLSLILIAVFSGIFVFVAFTVVKRNEYYKSLTVFFIRIVVRTIIKKNPEK